jgi:PPOX class probable FMN-dependent enzyme
VSVLDDAVDLRTIYPAPKERSLRKELHRLDEHCAHFIRLAPLCILASATSSGDPDISPRGGDPGFVRVLDAHTLLLPDRPGNNRLDSLSKIAENPAVALLFLVPGVDETLRVFGNARIELPHDDLIEEGERKPDPSVMRVDVTRAYFHCAKALMRAHLWSEEAKIERDSFPTLGQILKDQLQSEGPVEAQEEMVRRYAEEL